MLILVVNTLGPCFVQLGIFTTVKAESDQWLSGWPYRKQHNITRVPLGESTLFYDLSNPWATISGNPVDQHTFQPVHNTTIVEVDKVADGATWKYFAYDSDSAGSEIRLFFTNNIDDSWTAYSGNPILGPDQTSFRWPSVAYVNGTFHMFLEDLTKGTLERWTSNDGINFTFKQDVMSGTYPFNPFVWFNPNDDRWYLYSHCFFNGTEYINVRDAADIEYLGQANDTSIVSRVDSLGSPTIAYFDSQYWLLVEILVSGRWKTSAYYSLSPSAGFKECYNSPILSEDEACAMFFLGPNQTQAYLFSSVDSSNWFEQTREVYVNSSFKPLLDNLYGYQVKITAHYGNGTDSGEDVYLNGHSRIDFGDVRFTWFNSSSLSEVECNYWIEDLTAQDNARFWVKIPEISAETNSTIYVYYGRDDMVTTSNGNNTFDFFDDFSGTLSKWTIVGGTWQVQNGVLNSYTTDFGQRIRANGFSFGNDSVSVKMKWISGTYFENGPYVRGQLPNEQTYGYMAFLSTWVGDQKLRLSRMREGPYGSTVASEGTTAPSKNVWYDCTFQLYGNRLKGSIGPLYTTEISGTDNSFSNGTLSIFSWSAVSERVQFDDLFVRKYVEPEPSNGGWGAEEVTDSVIIDQTWVSDWRADVGSSQVIGFHVRWNINGSDTVGGSIYVNYTQYITNGTGWISLGVTSLEVRRDMWIVSGVNCSGVTMYTQTVQAPSIVWDRIRIIDEGTTEESVSLGDTTALWCKAVYEYDNNVFSVANGILYLNDSAMSWSTNNTRWEYAYTSSTLGSQTFATSKVYDISYNLTTIKDVLGAQTIDVWSSPFLIVSNSTISQLTFNSTNGTLSFVVSGPSGTKGYTNVTLRKTLVQDIGQLEIYLDGGEINYTTIATEYSWLIHFSYNHSTHKVVLNLNTAGISTVSSVKNPFETVAYVIGGIAVTILIAIWVIIKRRHSAATDHHDLD